MAKIVIKLVVMLAIVVGISNYAMYIMTGKSPFSGFSSDISINTPEVSDLLPKGKDRVYKWTDENGVVQYSSEAPQGAETETMTIDPNTNVIQGLRPAAKKEAPQATSPPAQAQLPQGSIYNPENIRQLIDDAKNVQTTLNQRYETLEDQ